jgi:hypothetical protein
MSIKQTLAFLILITPYITSTWGDEDYRYAWPNTGSIKPKNGYSFSKEPEFTYAYLPDPRYLDSFVDPDIDYPSQGTGNAYN